MTDIHVGFTGTSKGMTQGQKSYVQNGLLDLNVEAHRIGGILHFHHGDCVGADEQAHAIAVSILTPNLIRVHIHPPDNDKKRAFCKSVNIHPAKPYLVRNHDIVDASSVIFVVPKGHIEELRSGTWATYRYAKKKGIDIIMVER